MKIKTLIIGSFIIAGILTGCNGQSATTTAETQTTTESESTTSEIALENEKGIASFSFAQGKTSDTIEETEPVVEEAEDNTKDTEVQATNKGTKAFDRFDESVLSPDIPKEYRDKLIKYAKSMADYYDADKNIYLETADGFVDDKKDGIVDAAEAKATIDFVEEATGGNIPSLDIESIIQSEAVDYSGNYIDDGVHGTPDSGELPVVDWGSGDHSNASTTAQPY